MVPNYNSPLNALYVIRTDSGKEKHLLTGKRPPAEVQGVAAVFCDWLGVRGGDWTKENEHYLDSLAITNHIYPAFPVLCFPIDTVGGSLLHGPSISVSLFLFHSQTKSNSSYSSWSTPEVSCEICWVNQSKGNSMVVHSCCTLFCRMSFTCCNCYAHQGEVSKYVGPHLVSYSNQSYNIRTWVSVKTLSNTATVFASHAAFFFLIFDVYFFPFLNRFHCFLSCPLSIIQQSICTLCV